MHRSLEGEEHTPQKALKLQPCIFHFQKKSPDLHTKANVTIAITQQLYMMSPLRMVQTSSAQLVLHLDGFFVVGIAIGIHAASDCAVARKLWSGGVSDDAHPRNARLARRVRVVVRRTRVLWRVDELRKNFSRTKRSRILDG